MMTALLEGDEKTANAAGTAASGAAAGGKPEDDSVFATAAPPPADDNLLEASALEGECTLEGLFSLQLPGVESLGSLLLGNMSLPPEIAGMAPGADLARLTSHFPGLGAAPSSRLASQPGLAAPMPAAAPVSVPAAVAAPALQQQAAQPPTDAQGAAAQAPLPPEQPSSTGVVVVGGGRDSTGDTPFASIGSPPPVASPAGSQVAETRKRAAAGDASAMAGPPKAQRYGGTPLEAAGGVHEAPMAQPAGVGVAAGGGAMGGGAAEEELEALRGQVSELTNLAKMQVQELKLLRAALRQLYRKYQQSKAEVQQLRGGNFPGTAQVSQAGGMAGGAAGPGIAGETFTTPFVRASPLPGAGASAGMSQPFPGPFNNGSHAAPPQLPKPGYAGAGFVAAMQAGNIHAPNPYGAGIGVTSTGYGGASTMAPPGPHAYAGAFNQVVSGDPNKPAAPPTYPMHQLPQQSAAQQYMGAPTQQQQYGSYQHQPYQ